MFGCKVGSTLPPASAIVVNVGLLKAMPTSMVDGSLFSGDVSLLEDLRALSFLDRCFDDDESSS